MNVKYKTKFNLKDGAINPFLHDKGGSEGKVLSDKIVKVRSEHECVECGNDIRSGSLAYALKVACYGTIGTSYTCQYCLEAVALDHQDGGLRIEDRRRLLELRI